MTTLHVEMAALASARQQSEDQCMQLQGELAGSRREVQALMARFLPAGLDGSGTSPTAKAATGSPFAQKQTANGVSSSLQ